jgi:hypothetical protein
MWRKVSLIVVSTILWAGAALSDEVIKGRYCYTYGDSESLREAKALTRTLALRDAIESYRVFVESVGTVQNFNLTNDLVQVISSGYLKNIQVLESKIEGRTICETIQASVSPEEIGDFVKKMVKKRAQEVETLGVDNNGCLKILKVEAKDNQVAVVVRVLTRTGSLGSPAEQGQKPCFKIGIDFLGQDGEPMNGDAQFVHTSGSEMLPGEIRTVYFDLPFGVKSYKVWLPKP